MSEFYGYESVSAKVRVMFGRRLFPGDYDELLQKRSAQDIASFLTAHQAYHSVLADVDERFILRGQL